MSRVDRNTIYFQLDNGAECNVISALIMYITRPRKLDHSAKLIGANANTPTHMSYVGDTYIFGQAFYDPNSRNILSEPALQILGFKCINLKGDPRFPNLTTQTTVIGEHGTAIFKIKGVGKGLVLLATLEEVLKLHPPIIVAAITKRFTRSHDTDPEPIDIPIINNNKIKNKNNNKININKQNSNLNNDDNNNNINSNSHAINVSDTPIIISPEANMLLSTEPIVNQLSNIDLTSSSKYVTSLKRNLTKQELVKYNIVHKLHYVSHNGEDAMCKLITGGHLLDCNLTAQDVHMYFEIRPACLACLANMKMPKQEPHVIPSGTLLGAWWEMDIMQWRVKYYAIFVEGISGALFGYPTASTSRKSAQACALAFKLHINKYFKGVTAGTVITLVADKQKSFIEFKLLPEFDIRDTSVEGHANRAEAAIQKIEFFMRAKTSEILYKYNYKLPVCLDGDLVEFICMIKNFMLGTLNHNQTPNEMNTINSKMSLGHMIDLQFGQMVRAIIPSANRKGPKCDPRSEDGILIGFEACSPNHKIIYLPSRGVRVSRVKTVDTDENNILVDMMNQLHDKNIWRIVDPNPKPIEGEEMIISAIYMEKPIDRSNMSLHEANKVHSIDVIKDSLKVEWNNFDTRNVLDLSKKKLPNAPAIKVVCRDKGADNAFELMKLRMCYPGNLQKLGTYGKTIAPTTHKEIIFLVLAFNKGIKGQISCYDVPAAFLNSPLMEEVNVKIPSKLVELLIQVFPKLQEYVQDDGCIYAGVLMSLYGLKQGPRNWFLIICSIMLVELGMTQCPSEACVFYYKHEDTSKYTVSLIHVDDCLKSSNDPMVSSKMEATMHKLFGGKKEWQFGEINFLNMHMTRQPDFSVTVDNAAYVMDIVKRRYTQDMEEEFGNKRGLICPSNLELFTEVEEAGFVASEIDITNYKSIIGELLHATIIRIDILKETTYLAKKSENPMPNHWKAYRRVIFYLRYYPSLPINLGAELNSTITCYVDASFATHTDMKSHTGMIVTVGENGGPLDCKSQVQSIHTNSSSEAELVASVVAANHGLFLGRVAKDLGYVKSENLLMILKQDNESTIRIIENGEGMGGKARYFRIRHAHLKELVDQNIMKVEYCSSENMLPDYMTKCMTGKQLYSQIVRAMYHGDEKEFAKQAQLAFQRVSKVDGK